MSDSAPHAPANTSSYICYLLRLISRELVAQGYRLDARVDVFIVLSQFLCRALHAVPRARRRTALVHSSLYPSRIRSCELSLLTSAISAVIEEAIRDITGFTPAKVSFTPLSFGSIDRS